MIILFTHLLFLNILIFTFHTKISKKFNVFDFPDKLRKKQKSKIPITGGMIILLNYLLIIFLNFIYELNFFDHLDLSKIDWYLSFIIIPIMFYLIGLYDDKYDLRPSIKILLSLILFYIVINLDDNFLLREIYIFSFKFNISILKYSIFISLLCYLLFQHAFNMFDGINLQTGLYSIIFLIILFYISEIEFFLLLIIPLLFFLFLNFKNRSYMGDGGCYLLSYLLSIYCVYFYNSAQLNIEQIFLLMMVPGIDMLRLFIHRIYIGKSPFSSDREHLHHYLTSRFSNFSSNLITMLFIAVPILSYMFLQNFNLILIISVFFYLFLLYLIKKRS